jgi:predicted dinucleotide-binding enzyme
MRIGIVGGTGPAGRGLALRLAAAGDQVVVGSRQAERAQEIVAGLLEAWPDRPLPIVGGTNPWPTPW